MELKFRDLRAEDIECRIALCNAKGVSLLLYKDARVDQAVLDETVGPMNWQRHHSRDNANCTVSIWDADKKIWIEKEDTGTESNTEKEKGLASDSFKRACFNWGIGRELYTAPFIWVDAAKLKKHKQNDKGRWECKDTFSVVGFTVSNKAITTFAIKNDLTGDIVCMWKAGVKPAQPAPEATPAHSTKPVEEMKYRCIQCGEELKPYIGADGREVSLRKHAEGSTAKYGDVFCINCIKKKQAIEAVEKAKI